MLNTIHLYPNAEEENFNVSFLTSANDISIEDLVVMNMKEFEVIQNITILGYYLETDPEKIDINEHTININYKRKSDKLDIPKYKYLNPDRVAEMVFTIEIKTNVNQKVITKKILIPVEYNGFYYIGNKKWKTEWQLCDASTYNQRGKITLKSRMPIIIYQTKHRPIMDLEGMIHDTRTYSYALNSKSRFNSAKPKPKFINPMMIYSAKMGLEEAIVYMGAGPDISILSRSKAEYKEYDNLDEFYYFNINEVVFRVDKYMMDTNKHIASIVGMLKSLESNEFPVSYALLSNFEEEKQYWRCRIGYVGAAKSKNLLSFLEKGNTTIKMFERLLDNVTQMNLRLEEPYKRDIYALMKWMLYEFDNLKTRNNMDLNNKRIRKAEYIVQPTLGKKIAENIIKIIEKSGKSSQNIIDTLLEGFNFPSDIIISGMRSNGYLIKSDELVNDFTALSDLYYSSKGPNSLGENSSKMISQKYRNIHPSFMGSIDINVSSNSDVGMSGAFTPFVKLYNNFYFTPEGEPDQEMYMLAKDHDAHYKEIGYDKMQTPENVNFDNYDEYLEYLKNKARPKRLDPEVIKIVEKVTDPFVPVVSKATITREDALQTEETSEDENQMDDSEDNEVNESEGE